MNANDSPNEIGQIAIILSWDFDDTIDENQDGIFTNDNQAQGFEVSSSWASVGNKIVTLTATTNWILRQPITLFQSLILFPQSL